MPHLSTNDIVAAAVARIDWARLGSDRRRLRADLAMVRRAARDNWLRDGPVLDALSGRLLRLLRELRDEPGRGGDVVAVVGVAGNVLDAMAAAGEAERARAFVAALRELGQGGGCA
ncbi:MAG: hypothetical protein LW650_02790 [Planctomycetaceae bacterium]|jgi:hypothetical protein|nr:hypothetical protein [Phycisphaerales bacterium]MCE2652449.1 hypothetical protein [Planctomycetaceae bacterium]